MIQRAAAAEDVIQEVVARVTGALQPWRIVLFGSRARGDWMEDSDFDFYVEIEVASEERLTDVWHRLHRLCSSAECTFDFKVQRPGDLERRRDDPGTIEWDVAREGRVVYASSGASVDIAPAASVREPAPGVPKSFEKWVGLAEQELLVRNVLRDQGRQTFASHVCWLSQQAAEKFMKALLVSRRVHPEHTHNLEELLSAVRDTGRPLDGLDADCQFLSAFAVEPRYADLGMFDAEDATSACDASDRVIRAVRALLPLPEH